MELDTSYNNISEVLSLLQKYKQKMITHNDDNYTNKLYNYRHYVQSFFQRYMYQGKTINILELLTFPRNSLLKTTIC